MKAITSFKNLFTKEKAFIHLKSIPIRLFNKILDLRFINKINFKLIIL